MRKKLFSRFERFVIWGVRNQVHSHHYIHRGFFAAAQNLGIEVIWLPDLSSSSSFLKKDDLILCVNVASRYLPVKDDYFYVLHNFSENINLPKERHIHLQVLTTSTHKNVYPGARKLLGLSWYNSDKRLLVQPWGTPVSIPQFDKPLDNRNCRFELFVGSIWNNELDQGNVDVIQEFKNSLKGFSKVFGHSRYIPESLMKYAVKSSPVSASFVGKWQSENGYLPCRLFKAISFGKVGLINSEFAKDMLNLEIEGRTVQEQLEFCFSLSSKNYLELARTHQIIIRDETYSMKIRNFITAFEIG